MKKFAVFEEMAEGIVVCNSSGKIILWNNAMEKITGLSKFDALNKKFWDVKDKLIAYNNQNLSKDKIKAIWESNAFKKIILSLKGKTHELELKRTDNKHIIVEQSFLLSEAEFDDFFIISLIKDVSEKKKLEQAQIDAINILIHDIRGPISTIIGFLNLSMEEDVSIEKVKNYSTIINNVAENLLKKTNCYLQLRKIENSQNKIDKQLVSVLQISALVNEVSKSLKIGEKIKVLFNNWVIENTHIELLEKKVDINILLFESVLTNLIQNAHEASTNMDSEILVNVHEEKNFFCLSVSNSGDIPENIRKNLFQKFNTSKKIGTGLGLFSSKLIIEAHGGELKYVPSSGSTTFTVKLPFSV